MHSVLLLALGIGFVAGLRSMTAPALVCWAAHLQWIHLQGTPLGFMASPIAVGIFTLAAIAELVADKLPKTPARTAAGPLIGASSWRLFAERAFMQRLQRLLSWVP